MADEDFYTLVVNGVHCSFTAADVDIAGLDNDLCLRINLIGVGAGPAVLDLCRVLEVSSSEYEERRWKLARQAEAFNAGESTGKEEQP